jgi:hypothetical protein
MGIKEEKVFFECYNKAKLIKTKHKLILMTQPDETSTGEEEEEEGEDEDEDFDFDDDEEGCVDEDFEDASCKLKQFYLEDLKTIELLKGSKKIKDYLDVQNMGRSNAEITLKINRGKRPYKVFYAQSMAVWKVIYEVNIGENSTMILYAVIDNNSSNNWTDINLNLVSEIPYSADANLFSIIQLEKTRRVRYEKTRMLMKKKSFEEEEEARAEMEMEPLQEAKVSNVGAIKGTFKRFETKATIEKNESSKVFLKSYKVKTENWLYYNGTHSNPDMTVNVMIDEGFSMSGPLTVYKGGVYLGEEDVDVIKGKNEKNFFMYAKDLQTNISRWMESNLIMIKIVSYSKLVLKMRKYFQRDVIYTIKCSRDSTVKMRIIHQLASTKFVSNDNEMKELGIKKYDDLIIKKLKDDKTETNPASFISSEQNLWMKEQTIDLEMIRSFVIHKIEFYYEDKEYNLLNRMHIISLFNMNLALDSIKEAKPDLVNHTKLIEKSKTLQEQIIDLKSKMFNQMTENQHTELRVKIKKMTEELKEHENEINEIKSRLDKIKLKEGTKIKVKNIKPYFVEK